MEHAAADCHPEQISDIKLRYLSVYCSLHAATASVHDDVQA